MNSVAQQDNDLVDGESREVKGSGSRTYTLKNTGGVYSCSCPAWRNQSFAIERRTCKHLEAFRGKEPERLRTGGPLAAKAAAAGVSTAVASPELLPENHAGANVARAEGVPPALLLAHAWESDIDLTGWWMSEKLDGVRAYWDGAKLISRLGNMFHAPPWFLEGLPRDMPLDGELFGGRKKFQRTVSIVRRQDRGEAWREIQYVVFDAPAQTGPFEDRIAALEALVATRAVAHLRAHPHERVRDLAHVQAELARVEGLGGEGLMMRRPGSRYESGRSSSLLKVKTFHDTEAIVVGYRPGEGRHVGRVGALECALANGVRFSVGTGLSDAERENPPPVGAVITFRYQELSNDGVPRFPSYIGVRDDVTWPPTGTAPPPARAPAATQVPPLAATLRTFAKGDEMWSVKLPADVAAWREADRKIQERIADGWTEIT